MMQLLIGNNDAARPIACPLFPDKQISNKIPTQFPDLDTMNMATDWCIKRNGLHVDPDFIRYLPAVHQGRQLDKWY